MRVCQNSKNKAQQLVEFALVAPILVSILAVAIELGFILNEKAMLADVSKMAVLKSYEYTYTTSTDKDDKINQISQLIHDDVLENIAAHRNISETSTDYATLGTQIDVSIIPTSGPNALVFVTYVYNPVFTLPNILGGKIIPDHYTLRSTQIVSNSVFEQVGTNTVASTVNQLSNNVFLSRDNNFFTTKTLFSGVPIESVDPVLYHPIVGFLVDSGSGMLEFNKWDGTPVFAGCEVDKSSAVLVGSCPQAGDYYYNYVGNGNSITQVMYTDSDDNWCSNTSVCTDSSSAPIGETSANNQAFMSVYNVNASNLPDLNGQTEVNGSIDQIENTTQSCKAYALYGGAPSLAKFCVPSVYLPPASYDPGMSESDEYKLLTTQASFRLSKGVSSKWK